MNRPNFAKLVVLALCFIAAEIKSQNIIVTGANVGNGTYATLGAAFTAINAGSQLGAAINISIVGNTSESTTATLNTGAWNSLVIQPSGGIARSIIGTTSGNLINFNGADRVEIDGLNTGGNSLTIDNQNGGTAINFTNDAHRDTVRNTTIYSSNNSTGVVVFSTGSLTGNDSIGFYDCNISASVATGGFPANCVYSLGSAGMDNSSNTFSNCNLSDFFYSIWYSAGFKIDNNNNNWTIDGCRIFQSAPRTYSIGYQHRGIIIESGSNYTITNNVIGYATASGIGTYQMYANSGVRFVGIDLWLDAGPASYVDGNTISGIAIFTTSSQSNNSGVLCGINVASGDVQIGTNAGNTIGGISFDEMYVESTNPGALVVGINSVSTGSITITNNTIGSCSSSGITASVSGSVAGITVSGSLSSLTITNNTIGNTVGDNMRGGTAGFTTGSSYAYGIYVTNNAGPVITISGNTIRKLSSYGSGSQGYVRGITTGTGTTNAETYIIENNTIYDLVTTSANTSISQGLVAAAGIHLGAGTSSVIRGNTIYYIDINNSGTNQSYVAGIVHVNSTNVLIERNLIYSINNHGTSTSSTAPSIASGIIIRSAQGTVTVVNNMISIGLSTIWNGCYIGIMANHGSSPDPTIDYYYHNTINIGGNPSGNQPSFGFLRGDMTFTTRTVPVDFRNNVITNTRTGGTGIHYAIGNNYNATASSTGWGAGASNYNVLNTAGTGVGWWAGQRTFAQWQSTTSCDAQSLNGITVNYVNTLNNLHMVSGSNPLLEQAAPALPGVTDDFDSQPRTTCLVDLGADEFSGVRDINVTGNSVSITDGDVSPSFADFTMFDSTSVCNGTSSRTFTIQNTGLYPLSVSGVTITGAHASDFTITVPPAGTINGSGSTTITIEFNPSAAGIRTAIITISSDDCDEGTFDFAIAATGSQISIASTATINPQCFGSTNGSASVNIAGGIAPITYSWSSGGTSTVEMGLGAGIYSVTATDANGCTTATTVTLTEPTVLAIANVVSSDVTTCAVNDGAIDITVNGGTTAYTYMWSNAATTEDLTGLAAGSYSCTVTDANGCTVSTSTIVITAPVAPIVTYNEIIDSVCQTTTNAFALSAGSPVGGNWSGSGVNAGMFDPLFANIGWNVITYMYTDSVTLCSATAVDSIWVDLCMGVELPGNAPTVISVYPNPTNGILTIELDSEMQEGSAIELLSVEGKLVYSCMLSGSSSSKTQIDMSVMDSGTYFLTVRQGDSFEVIKVAKVE